MPAVLEAARQGLAQRKPEHARRITAGLEALNDVADGRDGFDQASEGAEQAEKTRSFPVV